MIPDPFDWKEYLIELVAFTLLMGALLLGFSLLAILITTN